MEMPIVRLMKLCLPGLQSSAALLFRNNGFADFGPLPPIHVMGD